MKRFITITIVLLMLTSVRGLALEITPGTLSAAIGNQSKTITTLTLTGTADARDLQFLSSLPMLKEVNMTGLDIVAVDSDTAVILNRRQFPANTIPAFMFALSSLEKITLPASVIEIEECAFASSGNLKELNFGQALRHIDNWACYGTPLQTVSLPAAVDSLGEGVFANCTSLSDVRLAGLKVKTLPAKTFRGCIALRSISFPSELTAIGAECFMGSGLETLVIPTSVQQSGDYAFSAMPMLKSVSLSDTKLGDGAFYGSTSLATVRGLKQLPALALAGCSQLQLDSVATSGCTTIGEYALADCGGERLWLSDKLQSVEANALHGMNNLHSLHGYDMGANVPEAAPGAFDGVPRISEIHLLVNQDYTSLWKQHPEWGRFNVIGVGAGVGEISDDIADLSVTVSLENSLLTLNSTEVMDNVSVYDTSGVLLLLASPKSTEASLDLSGVTAGVIVIRIATVRGVRIFKLIR